MSNQFNQPQLTTDERLARIEALLQRQGMRLDGLSWNHDQTYLNGDGLQIRDDAGTRRIQLGKRTFGSFVSEQFGLQIWDAAGTLVFDSAVATGTKANLSGWELNADYFESPSGNVGLNSEVTGGTDWRIWAGDTYANRASAPFRVDDDGNLVASSATITGSVTATSGAIGGWTISADKLSAGNVEINSANEQILLGSATDPTTGVGIFLGLDGADYEFRAGDPGGDNIHWDGSSLDIIGGITADSGAIGGWKITSTTIEHDAANPDIILDHATPQLLADYIGAGGGVAGTDYFTRIGPDGVETVRGSIGNWDIDGQNLIGTSGITPVIWLNSGTYYIAIKDRTFGNDGIQLQYNSGSPRFYVGDGGTEFVQYDGTNLTWQTGNTSLSSAGVLQLGSSPTIDLDPSVPKLESSTYVSGQAGFYLDDTLAEFGDITARGKIITTVLQYQAQSVVGGQLLVSPGAKLAADASATDTSIEVDEDPGFAAGDTLRMKEGGTAETVTIDGGYGGGTTVPLTAGLSNSWNKGVAVARWEQRILLDTVSANSPYIDVHDGTNPKARVGNLAGVAGASGYGLWSDNVFLEGEITATSGAIGGWEISADYFESPSNNAGLNSEVTGGTDWRIWAGDTYANRASAPFRVDDDGNLVASSATITGDITATSGELQALDVTGKLTLETGGSLVNNSETRPYFELTDTAFTLHDTGLYTTTVMSFDTDEHNTTGYLTLDEIDSFYIWADNGDDLSILDLDPTNYKIKFRFTHNTGTTAPTEIHFFTDTSRNSHISMRVTGTTEVLRFDAKSSTYYDAFIKNTASDGRMVFQAKNPWGSYNWLEVHPDNNEIYIRMKTDSGSTETLGTWDNDGLQLNSGDEYTAGSLSAGPWDQYCRLYKTSNQSISNNTITSVSWNAENTDPSGMHSTVTNNSRVTISDAGRYLVSASIEFAGSSSGTKREVFVYLNGSTIIAAQKQAPIGSSALTVNVTTQWDFNANDYVEIKVRQNTGGNLNVVTYATSHWLSSFEVHRLS